MLIRGITLCIGMNRKALEPRPGTPYKLYESRVPRGSQLSSVFPVLDFPPKPGYGDRNYQRKRFRLPPRLIGACVSTHLRGPVNSILSPMPATPVPPSMDDDRLAWLAMALAPGLGPRRILEGVRSLDAPSHIFRISLTELEGIALSRSGRAIHLRRQSAPGCGRGMGARGCSRARSILTYGCPDYPERLKEIYDPPPVLWVRGAAALAGAPVDCRRRHAASIALWHRRC